MNNQKIRNMELVNKEIYDEIHWWQFPLNEFSIKLYQHFKDTFFNKILTERSKSLEFASYINNQSKKYNKNWNFKRQRALIWDYKADAEFVPAWFVYETARYLKLDLLEIEENIIAYVTFRGKNIVYRPKLPVKVTPEFTAIPIHAMGDGCFTPNGNFCYTQKESYNLKRFVNILTNIFGDYKIVHTKRKYGTPTYVTPKIFAQIITQYYGIDTYLSCECEIPKKIKSSNKLHKLATLASFILDEGCTTSGIYLCSSNKKLLMDIINIAESLGYKCNSVVTSYRHKINPLWQNMYKVTMSASSIESFYLDLGALFKEYPSLHIGKKFDNIKKWVEIRNKSWYQRRKGETKQIILDFLRNGDKTAYELRDKAGVSLWTVYHHLQQLMKNDKVSKHRNGSYNFCYRLIR